MTLVAEVPTEQGWGIVLRIDNDLLWYSWFNRPARTDVHTNTPESIDFKQQDQQHLSVMGEISFADQESWELTSRWPEKAAYWWSLKEPFWLEVVGVVLGEIEETMWKTA